MFNNVKKLLLGNGLAQAIQFGSIVFLSRIYYPADFALLTQAQSIATILAVIATLQMHLSIPLTKGVDEARNTARIVESLSFFLFLVTFPIAIYFGKIYIFAFVLTLAVAVSNTCNSYLVFSGDFGRLSGFYIKRALLIVGVQFGCAALSVQDGLLWGAVIGEAATALYLRKATFGFSKIHLGLRAIWETTLRLRSFSFYGTTQELTSVAAFYAPLILFTSTLGADIGGQYAMVNRLVWGPTILLTSSIAQVLYHQFGKVPPRRGDSHSLSYLFLDRKIFLAAILGCLIAFQLEDLYLFVLGGQWGLASKMLPWGMTWGAVFLMSIPFRVACRVLHLQKYQLFVDGVTLSSIWLMFTFSGFTPIGMMQGLVGIAFMQNALLALAVWLSIRYKAPDMAGA
ncbi:hypothetical protein [Pseudomonas purpurea]|uniref:hypothetical protein n=1 Tax=Pseudomonas purpurea TaxID=3136737 RepID=UPI0032677C76